jgi:Fur family transcriptional regulator, ferric uptake regulator
MGIEGMRLFGRNHKHSEDRQMIDALGEKGYRMTPQRLMIVSAIAGSDDHVSAEEVFSQVLEKYPNVNISTVYRTLDLLEELGLVTKTDLGGGRVRYHPADKGHHHHLVCRDCGAIIDLDESALSVLKETLLRDYGFIADLKHLGIWGRCIRCQKKIVRDT